MSDTPPRYTIHEAETELSRIVARVERGEEIVLLRDHAPVARVVPVKPSAKRLAGRLKDKIKIGGEFFEPLPAEELGAWGET